MVCPLFCVSWAGDGHLHPSGRCAPLSGNARLDGTRILPHSLDQEDPEEWGSSFSGEGRTHA